MARPKRSSAVLDKAMRRLAGMRSIDNTLKFGDGLSLTEYDVRLQTLQTQLSSYNTMLSALDEMAGRLGQLEQGVRSYSEKMLMSVATRYGKDSLEYMQAGGTQRKTARQSNATPTTMIAPVATSIETNGNGAKVTAS